MEVNYEMVNAAWPLPLPTIKVPVALARANSLYKRFMNSEVGRRKRRDYFVQSRRSWASTESTANSPRSGFREMVHDVSHIVFQKAHPTLLGHSHRHAELEYRMIRYVVEKTNWLTPEEAAVVTRDEAMEAKRSSLLSRQKTWTTKAKRAETALAQIEAQLKALGKGVLPRGRKKTKKKLSYEEDYKRRESSAKRKARALLKQYPGIEWDFISNDPHKEPPRAVHPPENLFRNDQDDPHEGDHVTDNWQDVLAYTEEYANLIAKKS